MKRGYVVTLFCGSIGLMIWGQLSRTEDQSVTSFSGIGGILAIAFGRMLVLERMIDSRAIKLGSESLPPAKDVAAITVRGKAIDEAPKKVLLHALRKSTRALKCDTVVEEVPFQIVDHWGGIRDLIAYKESAGRRGFIIGRVAYDGRHAERVAQCVGML